MEKWLEGGNVLEKKESMNKNNDLRRKWTVLIY